MKKIMITLVVTCLGFVASAASLKWSMNTIKTIDGSANAGNTYMALCFVSADSSASITTWSVDDAVSALKAGTLKTTDAATTKTLISGMALSGSVTKDTWIEGTEVSAFAIIVDSTSLDEVKNYMVVDPVSYTFGSAGETKTLAYGSQAANTWQAVPEPTSGLLLLLGVAGLALRRKTA